MLHRDNDSGELMHSQAAQDATYLESTSTGTNSTASTALSPSQDYATLLLKMRGELLRQETSAQLAIEHQLQEIRIALRRIEVGTYGICETCDEPIAAKRLVRLPFARCCVGCQQEFEES